MHTHSAVLLFFLFVLFLKTAAMTKMSATTTITITTMARDRIKDLHVLIDEG